MLLAAALAALLAPAGCAQPSGQIATIDVLRIQANWPKFINYQNQLQADANAIARSSIPEKEKERQAARLRQRFVDMQNEVTQDVRDAVGKIAAERHFSLVVTHEYTGYGGTDITPDVEKLLNITERTPGAST